MLVAQQFTNAQVKTETSLRSECSKNQSLKLNNKTKNRKSVHKAPMLFALFVEPGKIETLP